MLSRINENDVKEEIRLLNRDKDDGNYIEKAIDFNNQQERQKKQIFINPNLTNETERTDANTNANTSYLPDNLNQTTNNNTTYFTPIPNRSTNLLASTPKRGRAVSRIRGRTPTMQPINETSLEINPEGNFTCKFCNAKFAEKNVLIEHLLTAHNKDINRYEHSSLFDKTFETSTSHNLYSYSPAYVDESDAHMQTLDNSRNFEISTPSNLNTLSFRNTGATPKRANVRSSTPMPETSNKNTSKSRKKAKPYRIPSTEELLDSTKTSYNSRASENNDFYKSLKNLKVVLQPLNIPAQSDNLTTPNNRGTKRKFEFTPRYTIKKRKNKLAMTTPKHGGKKRKIDYTPQKTVKRKKISLTINKKHTPTKTKSRYNEDEFETTGLKKKTMKNKYGRDVSTWFSGVEEPQKQ